MKNNNKNKESKIYNMSNFKMTKLEKISLSSILKNENKLVKTNFTNNEWEMLITNSLKDQLIKANIINETKERVTMMYDI